MTILSVKELWYYIVNQLSTVSFLDIVDIVLVTVIFFYAIRFMRARRAGKLALGIVLLTAMLVLSEVIGLSSLNFILRNFFQLGFIAVIVLFAPEMRSALEKIGTGSVKSFRVKESAGLQYITEICAAAESLSYTKTGALIVFERDTKLGEIIKTGTVIDAQVGAFLVCNIFYPKAPLHDGALIVRNGRLCAAGCFLPLSSNNDIVKNLGTRHRAGIGMSENSDAVVLIVSEETGIISVAVDGELRRGYTRTSLERRLKELLDEGGASNAFGKFTSKTKEFIRKGGERND